jgi:hypothetical protein
MPIDLLEQGVFEPEALVAMGDAFGTACKELHVAREPEVVRQLIAERIVAAARRGELDPVRLRTASLNGLSVGHVSPAEATTLTEQLLNPQRHL